MDRLDYLNGLLRPQLGGDAFRPANDRIKEFGFSTDYAKAMTANLYEGSIDSGRAMVSLAAMARSKGIEIKTGAEVVKLEENAEEAVVALKDGLRNETLMLRCDTLTICTNAFARQLLPDEDVTPGRGQVLVTKPIEGLRFKGVFHFDAGYYYFREIDGRVLFVGGRNLDFEGEQTTVIALNELIQQDLERKLQEIILPGQLIEIDMRWSGIMAFGNTKAPIIKAYSDHIFGVFRMGGMGIALGSTAAAELVALIKERR
jgi:glycine/D-amino acid oxidase-like deaminating enzyme